MLVSIAGCSDPKPKSESEARARCDALLASISEAGSDRRVTPEETAAIENATATMRESDGYVEGRAPEGALQKCTRPPAVGDVEARP
jgi:hypothetical protein